MTRLLQAAGGRDHSHRARAAPLPLRLPAAAGGTAAGCPGPSHSHARQTAAIRITRPTTEQLVGHCRDHTAKSESAPRGRFLYDRNPQFLVARGVFCAFRSFDLQRAAGSKPNVFVFTAWQRCVESREQKETHTNIMGGAAHPMLALWNQFPGFAKGCPVAWRSLLRKGAEPISR